MNSKKNTKLIIKKKPQKTKHWKQVLLLHVCCKANNTRVVGFVCISPFVPQNAPDCNVTSHVMTGTMSWDPPLTTRPPPCSSPPSPRTACDYAEGVIQLIIDSTRNHHLDLLDLLPINLCCSLPSLCQALRGWKGNKNNKDRAFLGALYQLERLRTPQSSGMQSILF